MHPLFRRLVLSGRRSWAVVALMAILAHVTALAGGFIWLDHAHIEGGLALAPLGHLLSLFDHGFAGTGFYRPFMSLSLSLDAALGGSPALFHATTLVWHAAAAVSVVVAAEALGLSARAATLAGLLFGVHPATSLVANAIAFRSEAMLAVALLWLVVFHVRRRPWLAAIALLAGALTKETALVLGPLFLAALTLIGRARPVAPRLGSARPTLRRVLVAEAVAFAVAVGLRLAFAPAWRAAFPALSASEAIGTRLAVLSRSVLLLAPPFDRTVCDAFAVVPALGARSLGGALIGAGVLFAVWRRGAPALLMALSLLPALQVVPIARWWSPHYLYVPLAFAVMGLADVLDRRARLAQLAALGAAGVMALLSLQEGRRYRADEPFWAAELAAQPSCREGHFYTAEILRERGDLEDAAIHYELALAWRPGVLAYVDRPAALQNLGVVRLAQGHLAQAQAAFASARDLTTDEEARRELTHNMAAVALRAGNAEEAAQLLERETARPDALPQSTFLHARALQALGHADQAQALLRRLPAPPYRSR